MKCKEAQRLALKWYETHDEMDKVDYLTHRKYCTVCQLEFVRNNKEMEQDIDTYEYDDEAIGI